MRPWLIFALLLALLGALGGCGAKPAPAASSEQTGVPAGSASWEEPGRESAPVEEEPSREEEETMESSCFYITAGATTFTAVFEENSSAEALEELLEQGDLTLSMQDYGGFEKVGSLDTRLPENREQITTGPGDVILYQGNSITIYYDTNTWNFTRLGKIEGATKEALLAALGEGDVEVTFSLARPEQ